MRISLTPLRLLQKQVTHTSCESIQEAVVVSAGAEASINAWWGGGVLFHGGSPPGQEQVSLWDCLRITLVLSSD